MHLTGRRGRGRAALAALAFLCFALGAGCFGPKDEDAIAPARAYVEAMAARDFARAQGVLRGEALDGYLALLPGLRGTEYTAKLLRADFRVEEKSRVRAVVAGDYDLEIEVPGYGKFSQGVAAEFLVKKCEEGWKVYSVRVLGTR